eukprot:tig00020807_g14058.t1
MEEGERSVRQKTDVGEAARSKMDVVYTTIMTSASSSTPAPAGSPSAEAQFEFAELKAATDNFDLSRYLGQGGFGCVFRGRLPVNGDVRDVAVKVAKTPSEGREMKEVSRLRALPPHPNVVACLGSARVDEAFSRALPHGGADSPVYLPTGALCVVYEYVGPHNLQERLCGAPGEEAAGARADLAPLSWAERVRILLDVARGMAHLHASGAIHRDLRGCNVLVRPGGSGVIADFGLAALLEANGQYTTRYSTGPRGCTAPEIYEENVATPASDSYSFGVLALEAVTGSPGFVWTREPKALVSLVQKSWDEAAQRAVEARIDRRAGEAPAWLPGTLVQIARHCTQRYPEDRLTAPELVAMLGVVAAAIGVPLDEPAPPPLDPLSSANARKCRKKRVVFAFRSADEGSFIKAKGPSHGSRGDWVIVNCDVERPAAGGEDVYICPDPTFREMYEPVPGRPHVYRKIKPVWASKMPRPFLINDRGKVSFGNAGDYVVQNRLGTDQIIEQYPVSASEFERDYEYFK